MISATIITLNEEKKIASALRSLQRLVKEIVVVDSGSTDKTLEIAKKFRAKIFFRKFDNFANQKNFALSKVTGDWVLSIDADEEIPNDLAKEIKQTIKKTKVVGFLIPRRNFILGKEIKYSRWSPDRHIWLWKKDFGKWEGMVHEEVKVSGEVASIKHPKIHNSHQTITDFMTTNNFYSELESQSLFKSKINFSFPGMLWDPFAEFILRYIYKMGFLDGKRGFILAYLMGIYKLMVWVKLWHLQMEQK